MKIFKLKDGKKYDMGQGKTTCVISPEQGAKNITLNYAEFAPGDAFAQHVHPHSEDVIVVLEGKGVIKVEGKEYPIEAGDVVYVPPGERHGTIAGTAMTMFSCQAPPDTNLYSGKYIAGESQEGSK